MFGTHADPTSVWRERASRSTSSACAPSRTATSRRRPSPASPPARGRITAIAKSLTNRYHPTVELFLAHADQVRRAERLGRELRRAARRARARGRGRIHRSTAKERSRTCWSRRVIRGSSASRRGARLRAARVRGEGRGRRCRHGSGDRVAERARGRLGGRLGPAARAAAPAAQRPARVLLEARPRGVPSPRARRERSGCCTIWGGPRIRPAGVGRRRPGQPSVSRHARLPGDRGDRLPQGLARGRTPRRPGRGPRPRDARPVPRARPRLDGSRPHGRPAHALDRGSRGQWAFPAADTIAGAKYAARAFTRRVCRTR